MKALSPRGIRNHNPLNIERGDPWQGLAKPFEMSPEQRDEPRYCVFRAPEWGVRAAAIILMNYRDRHNRRTIAQIIERWAPAAENHTNAYIRFVANDLGISSSKEIDVACHEAVSALIKAMCKFENGQMPYDQATIDKGLMLAGIEPPMQLPTPVNSRTVAGGTVAGAAIAVDAALNGIPDVQAAIERASGMSGILGALLVITALLGIGIALYAKYDDARNGRLA